MPPNSRRLPSTSSSSPRGGCSDTAGVNCTAHAAICPSAAASAAGSRCRWFNAGASAHAVARLIPGRMPLARACSLQTATHGPSVTAHGSERADAGRNDSSGKSGK